MVKNFLIGRMQRVKMGEILSEKIEITSGIPQGSILRPLIFLIYDLEKGIKLNLKLFVHECIIYREIISEEDSKILQDNIQRVEKWASMNGMMINAKKSNHITFTDEREERA